MTAARFLLRFERSARAIRRALGLRRVAVGLGAGMLAGACGALWVWTLRDPVPRLWPFFSLTLLGGWLAGLLRAVAR